MLGGVALNPDSANPRCQSVCRPRQGSNKSRPQGINGGDQSGSRRPGTPWENSKRNKSLDLDFNEAGWSLPAPANETASDVTPALAAVSFSATESKPTISICRRLLYSTPRAYFGQALINSAATVSAKRALTGPLARLSRPSGSVDTDLFCRRNIPKKPRLFLGRRSAACTASLYIARSLQQGRVGCPSARGAQR